MATYPKIKNNDNGLSILDRLTNYGNPLVTNGTIEIVEDTSFLIKKLSSPSTGAQESFCVLFIENRGDAGTSLQINSISLKQEDENGDLVIVSSSGGVYTPTNDVDGQHKPFVITPLQRTSAIAYTANEAFMGTVNASFAEETANTHTKAINDSQMASDLNLTLGSASFDTQTGAATRYIRLGVGSDGKVKILPLNSTEQVHQVVPIYKHTDLIGSANSIPSGRYAAILIKGSKIGQNFEATVTNSLFIEHNSDVFGAGTNDPYSINLRLDSDNLFIYSVFANNSSVATDTVALELYSRILPIPVDPLTTTSWTNTQTQFFPAGNYSLSTTEDYTAAMEASFTGDQESGSQIWNNIEASTAVLRSTSVTAFGNDEITGRDTSIVPESLDAKIQRTGNGDNSLLNSSNLSNSPFPVFDSATFTKIELDENISIPFKQASDSTILLQPTYEESNGVFGNFVLSDITKEAQITHTIRENDGIDGQAPTSFVNTIKYATYPLFTYPSTTVNSHSNGTITNLSGGFNSGLNGVNDYVGYHVHENDTFQQLENDINGNTPLINLAGIIAGTSSGSNHAAQHNQHHNIRINAINPSDDLNFNGISGSKTTDFNLYGGDTARLATSETGLNTSGDTVLATDVATSKISDISEKGSRFRNYTVEKAINTVIFESGIEANFLEQIARNVDGSYSSVTTEGLTTITSEYHAPITNWVPYYENNLSSGTNVVPFRTNSKILTLKSAAYRLRPSLAWTVRNNVADVTRGNVDVSPVTKFNFISSTLKKPSDGTQLYTLTNEADNIHSGLQEFNNSGTEFARHTSLIGVKMSAGSKVVEHRTNNLQFAAPFVVGAEIFTVPTGTDADPEILFPAGTKIVAVISETGSGSVEGTFESNVIAPFGDVGYTPAGSNNRSYLILSEDCLIGGDKDLCVGKPLYDYASRNTNFHSTSVNPDMFSAATSDKGEMTERDRVNSSYGIDLSYVIEETIPQYVKAGDNVHIETVDSGHTSEFNNISNPDVNTTNSVFAASANGTLTNDTDSDGVSNTTNVVNIYNFNPIEWGISDTSGAKKSRRSGMSVGSFNLSNGCAMITTTLGLAQLNPTTNKYNHKFTIDLFNKGVEDVFIKSVDLFDPVYIPEGQYTITPRALTDASDSPTWSFKFSNTDYSSDSSVIATDSATDFVGKTVTPNDVSYTSTGDGSFLASNKKSKELYKNRHVATNHIAPGKISSFDGVQVQDIDFTDGNSVLEVDFLVNAANSAGKYYKAVEVEYYRDVALEQKYTPIAGGTPTLRTFKQRPVWKTRILLEVDIDTAAVINISDVDGSALQTNSEILFGSIQV